MIRIKIDSDPISTRFINDNEFPLSSSLEKMDLISNLTFVLFQKPEI